MKDVEYQIFIGLKDSKIYKEVVTEHEFKEMVFRFFSQREIGFSLLDVQGGYLHDNGWFITENSLCINIIEPSDIDIIKLARSLNMYMNQDCSLVIRNTLKSNFLR